MLFSIVADWHFRYIAPMAESFEQGLRRMMEFIGRGVEAVIGKAKSAGAQVSTRGGVQPILSVDSQLESSRINEIIEASTQKMMKNLIPELNGTVAMELGDGPPSFAPHFLGFRAKAAVGVDIGGRGALKQGDASRGFAVRGDAARLPFVGNYFSYLIAKLATPFQGDISRAVREIGRVLSPGGQGVIVDFHPFGLYAKRGAGKARPADSAAARLEDYYRICKQAGIKVVDVRETFVDESMRQMFKDNEISVYRNLKGTPLIIFIFIYKPKGTK